MKNIRSVIALPVLAALAFGVYACRSGLAPEFNLENVRGGMLDSKDLKGKIVVVDFWATWCGPCIKEIPKYKKLREKLEGKDVEFIGITLESGKIEEVRPEVEKLNIPYPVVMGNDKVQEGFGGVAAFPTTFVVDKNWKVYKKYLGSTGSKTEKIEKDIETLLAKTEKTE